jgi:hypothetical protein
MRNRMKYAYLSGRVSPLEVEKALSGELIFADREAVLLLREGPHFVSPSVLNRRGVRHAAWRLAREPEVTASAAFAEGWVDALGTREEMDRSLSNPVLAELARRASSRRMSFPSRAAGLALERAEFALLNTLPDKQEGIGAFFGKRAPRFRVR